MPVTDIESAPSATLEAAVEKFGLEMPAKPRAIEHYCRLLWDWNEKINLTRHTDFDKFVARDLFDAYQLSTLIAPGEEVLDLGSGGVVPGILLAILRDDIEVSLCDSVGKKAKVLAEIARELELPCPVYAERAETVMVEMRYTTVTARAVGPLTKLMQWLQPCWPSAGRLHAVKGPRWKTERADAKQGGVMKGLKLSIVAEYITPGTEIENVVMEVKPQLQTFVGNRQVKRK